LWVLTGLLIQPGQNLRCPLSVPPYRPRLLYRYTPLYPSANFYTTTLATALCHSSHHRFLGWQQLEEGSSRRGGGQQEERSAIQTLLDMGQLRETAQTSSDQQAHTASNQQVQVTAGDQQVQVTAGDQQVRDQQVQVTAGDQQVQVTASSHSSDSNHSTDSENDSEEWEVESRFGSDPMNKGRARRKQRAMDRPPAAVLPPAPPAKEAIAGANSSHH
jgi:hypothetical protein